MKSKKVVVILVILVLNLVLAMGVMAFVYLETDFFKTEQQLFAKYIEQAGENLSSLKSEELETYRNKMSHTPYESEGTLQVNVQGGMIPEKVLNAMNNFNITFSGKTDKAKRQAENAIKINYSDNVSFPIQYKQTDNLYGISSDLLLKKYLAIDIEKLQNLAGNENLGISVGELEQEEIIHLFQRAKVIIAENISEKNYTKVGENSYALSINEKEAVTIATKLLQDFKNRSTVTEAQKDQINEMIENLQEIDAKAEEVIKITVNKEGTVTFKIREIGTVQVLTSSQNTAEIKVMLEDSEADILVKVIKAVKDNFVTYQINTTIGEGETEIGISLQAQYSNLELETAAEKYQISFDITEADETMTYDYTLDITKKFVSKIAIDSLGEGNSVLLNNMSEEYRNTLLGRLLEGMAAINRMQMESLGLGENENPIMYATPFGAMLYSVNQLPNETEDIPNQLNQLSTEN